MIVELPLPLTDHVWLVGYGVIMVNFRGEIPAKGNQDT